MNKLALNQEKTYIYPIWYSNKSSIEQVMKYGGQDSKTYPCGYEVEIVVRNKYRKRSMNNRLNNIVKKIETVASNSKVPSLDQNPNG